MKRLFVAAVLFAAATSLQAQRINLELPPALAAKAAESVDVTLDGAMLRLASKFLSDSDKDERAARAVVKKLDGIYVRVYEFDEDNVYDRSVVDHVRSQLGPSWKRIVTVQSRKKEKRENVEIYTDMRGDAITGLVVICAEPRELTFVNIVGPIDLEELASMEGQFGIPHLSKGSKKDRDDDND